MEKPAIIKYWDNVRRLTLKVLDRFPSEKFEFRPKPKMRSIAEQFDHILEVELLVRNGLVSQIWEPLPSPIQGCTAKAVLSETLIMEHQQTSQMLRVLPSDSFTRFYETRFGRLTGEGLIYMAIDEEIHHRGNLYVYLRLLNIVPPQMVQNYSELFTEE